MSTPVEAHTTPPIDGSACRLESPVLRALLDRLERDVRQVRERLRRTELARSGNGSANSVFVVHPAEVTADTNGRVCGHPEYAARQMG